ncbi:filamentous hemagglutinin N-terminal domain-containing protein [Pseudanabaena sp. UWO311]|uniref:two-partner secretion domain-containing protein n=1 Tax=Pseudanabaena sp. UWO311 TaxID=2487337 RepID=UPI00115BC2BF|nr:filamentous hemagglutinin N-terminal domain-containing protein [Pseudanabaena sp. UWO311]TYQ28623.1 filamentous hemagglutinin N-terminal domain-containing protein [Pseudanabaena sp. UWO311]
MKRAFRHICLSCACALSCLSAAFSASAQIVPDATLPVNSTVTTTGQVHTINGGTAVGVNLYHSFQDFSVPTNNTAHFNNAAQVQNVLSRVTGNSVSNIDGLIKANGNANLYLLNPNGIAFGANAKLEIGGTFVGSTANSFKFTDGSEFSATNPQAPPLLTMSVTPGVQYGVSNQGATISNLGNLSTGQDLVLNADKLDLQGSLQAGRDLTFQAQDSVKIRDTVSTPFWAVAGRDLLVQGNQSVDIFTLNNVNSGFWSGGNMVLRSDNPILGDAHFFAGSNFNVENLNGTSGKLLSPNDPVILASGDVILGDYTGASLHILAGGGVTLGNITINNVGVDVNTTINPSNTNLFNATKRYADLADFNLTEYQAIKNSDGTVKEVVPVAVPMRINGSTQATLDVRSGVDWSQLGGLPTTPILGTVAPSVVTYPIPASGRADITMNGKIRVSQPSGLVLLTNQFNPNTLSGEISAIRATRFDPENGIPLIYVIDTSTDVVGADGGDIRIYGRGDISFTLSRLDSGSGGKGGAISLSTNTGNISLNHSLLRSPGRNGGAISFSTNTGDISLLGEKNIGRFSSVTSYLDSSTFSSDSSSGNSGNGGAISFFTNTGDISLKYSRLSSYSISTSISSTNLSGNSGDGGAISFSTNTGDISLNSSQLDSYSNSRSGNPGNGGAISFSANTGISLTSSILNSSSSSDSGKPRNGGTISFSANTDISLTSSILDSSSISYLAGNTGNSGAISFFTNTGDITFNDLTSFANSISYDVYLNTLYSTSPYKGGTSGNGGAISLTTNTGNIFFNNYSSYSFSYSVSGNSGSGGNIFISAPKGSLIGSSGISSLNSFSLSELNQTSGNGGNIALAAKTQISGLELLTQSSSEQAGIVQISGLGDLYLNNLKVITSKTISLTLPPPLNKTFTFEVGKSGRSGDVTVTGVGSFTFDKTTINSITQGSDPAGNISITSPSTVTFQNNSQILSSTNNSGLAGSVTINAAKAISILDKSELNAQTTAAGKAGNITINTPLLNLDGTAQITTTATAASTNTDGGGSITLNASTMNLFGTVGIFAETQGVAPAGILKLNPYSNDSNLNIALANNSAISASTTASGNGGDLSLTAPQSINVAGNGKLAVETSGTGKAGNISFTTSQLTLTDGVLVSASTSGKGTAGDIFVKANNFNITNGARIETATSNSGNSGNIDVRVVDQFNLTGSKTGLFANTLTGSSGAGGNIFIDPQAVTLRDGAQIAVGSLGTGIGGNITLISNFLSLLNSSSITAETASTNGGNITLNIPNLLLLRYASNISTTAGTALAGGNGGNINITAGFIVGVKGENSDIFANAFRGNGGNVNITTNGIYGLEFRPLLTGFSDITASSQFGLQGSVLVTTPGIDPSRGLTTLPLNLADPSKQVNQSCVIGGKLANRNNSFTISGKGGVPKSPSDAASSNQALVELSDPVASSISQTPTIEQKTEITPETPTRLVEANTIIRRNGTIELVSASAPLSPAIPQLACPLSSNNDAIIATKTKSLALSDGETPSNIFTLENEKTGLFAVDINPVNNLNFTLDDEKTGLFAADINTVNNFTLEEEKIGLFASADSNGNNIALEADKLFTLEEEKIGLFAQNLTDKNNNTLINSSYVLIQYGDGISVISQDLSFSGDILQFANNLTLRDKDFITPANFNRVNIPA